jgi:choline transport protein
MCEIAEEIKDASKALPKAIMWSQTINSAMTFIMAVTLTFALDDVESVLSTPTRYPFIQIFYNAAQSLAATNIMTAIIIICLSTCCISQVATASRQIWSFARDHGLPFSGFLSRVQFLTFSPLLAIG